MGRSPNYDASLTRGPWSKDEDGILRSYIERNGVGKWKELPKLAGLKRCGKSCRLRWINYLQPGIKRGNFSEDEEKLIVNLHKDFGNRWSRIADQLEGRTDNEIKNYWNTTIKKKLLMKGIDPVTHQRRANFNILQNFPNLLSTASNLNDLAPNALNNNDAFHQITPNVQLLQTLINSIINSSLIPNMEAMIQLQSLIALHNSNHSTLNGFGMNNSSAGTSYFSSPATNAMPYVQNTANTTPLQVSSSIADHDSLNQTTFGYPVSNTNVFGLSGSFMNHGGCNSSGFGMNNSSASNMYFSSPDTNAMPYVQNTANTIPSLQVSSSIADHDSLNQTTFGHSVSNTNVFGLTGSFMNHGGCNSSGFGMNNSGVNASTSNVNDTTATTSYFSSPNTMFMPLQPSTNAMPSVQITSPQNMSRSQACDEENVISTSSDSLEFNWKDLLRACSRTDM